MKKHWKRPLKKAAAVLLSLALMTSPLADLGFMSIVQAEETTITITESKGYEEGAYVEWSPVSGADGYLAYVSKNQDSWTQLDDELIRNYGTYMRAEALGLTAGTWYIKIVAATFDSAKVQTGTVAEKVQEVTVTKHDRSGYAWVSGTASGAYNEDGSLKSNANVIYLTDANKDTIRLEVTGASNPCVGIQAILDGYKKGKETKPLCVRVIGNVTCPAGNGLSTDYKGDVVIEKANNAVGLTFEGVGEDAVANGWGIRIKNSSNVELRNIGFMNCSSDEGDNVGLQQGNDHVWVHHCDMFYGDAGSDADQAKGDGALDTKKSTYITHSYNHFWDSGKCNLQGANSSDTSNYITYHHNWYDHSDSRHPRVRVATVHVYNNYYDGNSKYGVGSTTDSDVFVENNYFRNCNKPMLISKQGSDTEETLSGETGGMIKAYGNIIEGAKSYKPYSTNSSDFDCYDVSGRDEQVPSTVKATSGGATYNNFDTASDFYSYTLDVAKDVPAKVEANAGRVNGGDFKWNFEDNTDDTSSDVDTELKAKLVNYTTSLVSVGGILGSSTTVYYTVTFDPNNGENTSSTQVVAYQPVAEPATPTTIPEGKVSFDGWYNGETKWNFSNPVTSNMTLTGKWLAEGENPGGGEGGEGGETTEATPIGTETVIYDVTASGLTHANFAVSGKLKSSVGTSGTYNGTSYTGNGLKMEDSTSIAFTTTTEKAKLVMLFDSNFVKKVKVDGTSYTATAGVASVDLTSAGAHTITKGDSTNLYAIYVIPEGGSVAPATEYTITVNLADGSATTSFTVTAGSAITTTQLPTPTREGYSFTGWVDGSNKAVVLPYTPTANMTITATWQENASGGEELDPDALYNLRLNAENIPAGTYTSDFTKNGFTVTATDGAEQSVVVDGNKKTINGTEYAQRLKLGGPGTKDYRSIKFTANAAATLQIGCMAASSNATYQMSVATLDSNDTFVDLKGTVNINNVATDCSDGNIPVPGSAVNYITLEIPEAGTYYIYGKDGGINFYFLNLIYANGVEMPTYTVTFNTMGGLSVDSQVVYQGEACVEPAATLKSGYTFGGWYADYACTTAYDFSTPVTGNITLYAKWTEGETGTNLVLDMKELPARDYKENFTKNGFSFRASASKNLTVDISAATVEDVNYTQRLKLNGAGSGSERSVSFTIDKDAILTLIAASGSAGTPRALTVTNGTTEYSIANIDGAAKFTQTLTAGTWYVYSASSGVNIYYMSVLGEDDTNPGTGDGNDPIVPGTDDGNDPINPGTGDGNDPVNPGTGDGGDKKPVNNEGLKVVLANPGVEYVYTGSAIKPAIIVTNNGEELTAGVDYTVKYSNNVKVSTEKRAATITVKGKGNLTGSNSTTFKIQPKNIADSDVVAGSIVVVKGSKAKPVLTYNNKNLTTKDYIYDASIKYNEDGYLVILGNGNFTGTRMLDVKTVDKKDLKKFAVTVGKESLTYDGTEKKPTITVVDKSSDAPLTENVDYRIVYGGSTVNAGTVKFTVVGLGMYSGTVTKSYKIKPLAVKDGSITVSGEDAAGYEFAPKGVTIGDDLTVTYKNDILTEGKDYKIAYSGNKKVGTAKYTVKFQGNYKGSTALKGTFTIKPLPLSDDIDGLKIVVGDKVYTGKPKAYKSVPIVSIDGVTVKASQYTVTYYKDANFETPIDKSGLSLGENEDSVTVYVKIVGKAKSNYAPANGEYATASYELCKKTANDLSKARVTFWDGSTKITKAEYTGNEIEPTVKVEIKDGKTWTEVPADKYEVSYSNNVNKGTASVVVTATGEDYAGSKTAKFKIVAKNLKSLTDLLKDLFGL